MLFFIIGVTTAFLKASQNEPSKREKFNNLVIEGRRISRQSFNRKFDMESNRHDLTGESMMTLRTSLRSKNFSQEVL